MAEPTAERFSRPGKPRVFRSIVLIVAMMAVGAALAIGLLALSEEPPRREAATLPPLVEAVVVQAEDVVQRFMGYGSAQAIRNVSLAAEVAATVVERVDGIRAGSPVTKDQVLIRLDDRQYRHASEQASALAQAEQAALDELAVEARNLEQLVRTAEKELRVAQDEKTRLTGLLERGHAARKEYDFANLAFQRARRVLQGYQREAAKIAPRQARLAASKRSFEAQAALARLNVQRCEIRAPWTGRIQSILVDVGDHVSPGLPVLTLIDPSRVEIPIQLPAAEYDRVRIGAPCRIESESLVGKLWRGEVARIAPVADEQTRTFAVYVIVDNTDQAQPLVPGRFVRAEVRGPVYPNAILVPRRACRNGQVFVVEDDVARVRSVTTERLIEERALVTGDLHGGDRVILSHLDKLADGSPVRVRATLSAASTPPEPSQQGSPDSSP